MNKLSNPKVNRRVVSKNEWLESRLELLKKEKEFTRFRDEVTTQRLQLPMVKIEKTYEFDGPNGKESLSDLFDGKSQLIIYHFMYSADWNEGCKSCSFIADHVETPRVHLENHDVSFVMVSRAPLEMLEQYKRRMGWTMKWVSSYKNDFNFDFNVSFTEEEMSEGNGTYNYRSKGFPSDEASGASFFYKDDASNVFHTYSVYERGLDILLGVYNWLDMTPKGRNETGPMGWLKHKDRY